MAQKMSRNRKTRKIFFTVFLLIGLLFTPFQSPSCAEELRCSAPVKKEDSAWKLIRKKTRARTFTEFMTPALDNHGNSIPYENGGQLGPTNTANIVWVDYEIAENTKLVYHQRFAMTYASTATDPAFSTVFRNPRFALRKVNVFKVPNLTTTYDLYFQPGLAREAERAGRDLEFGFRTVTYYLIPRSKVTLGAITEFTLARSNQLNAPHGSANLYSWLMPNASYELNKIFSTQHYLTLSFQHTRGTQGLQYDYPMPFNIQNGIGVNISENIWAAAFINNYLNTAPTWSNTWASLWLSLILL